MKTIILLSLFPLYAHSAGLIIDNNDQSDALVSVHNGHREEDWAGVAGISVPQPDYGAGGLFIGGYIGVVGYANNIGVYGTPRFKDGYAAWFDGDVVINGYLYGGWAQKIRSPLKAEEYIEQSAMLSEQATSTLMGTVQLDEAGQAWVELPAWFSALSQNFHYQLTAIGAAAPNLHIAQKLAQNRFLIAGGQAGMEVSWQISGQIESHWLDIQNEMNPQTRVQNRVQDLSDD